MSSDLISFRNVCTKNNSGNYILFHVNFILHKNEFLSIYGSAGSGKTTIYKVIAGYVEFAGEYKLYDKPISWYSEENINSINGKIGLMPSSLSFEESLTVLQNMKIISSNDSISPEEALEICNGSNLLKRNFMFLNGVERIKVYLAGLLMGNPELLILDEPSGELDEDRSKEIYDILERIYKRGVTILVLSRKQKFLSYSTKIMYLNKGRLT